MSKENFLFLLVLSVIGTWFLGSINNVSKAKSRFNVVYSPDRSKSVEMIQAIGTNQIMMNYHKNLIVSGSSILSGTFDTSRIEVIWESNQLVYIALPKESVINDSEDSARFFNETIFIKYIKH